MNRMMCCCRLFVFESPRIPYPLKAISYPCNQKRSKTAVNRAGGEVRIVVTIRIATRTREIRVITWIWCALCKCVTAQSEEGRGKKKANYF